MHAPPPDTRASAQSYVLAGLGLLAAFALVIVSASMNYRFGFSLGRTPEDGMIYGAASVAADAFKALSPFFFFAALRNRMWSQAMAAFVVWGVTTGYALVGATGHAALNRTDVAGKREVTSTAYADLRAEHKRITEQLSWVPHFRPAATVEADIAAKKTDRLYARTGGCDPASVTSTPARAYCSDLRKLEAERASAVEGARLQSRLDEIGAKLTAIGAAPTAADPQVAVFSRLTGWEAGSVTAALIMLVVLLLEVGSGLGPYVAMSYFPDRPRKRWPVIEQAPETVDEVAPAPATVEIEKNVVPFPKKQTVSEVSQEPTQSVSALAITLPYDKTQAEADLRGLLATLRQIPSQDVLAVRWGVRKGTVSRWLADWPWVSREQVGRVKFITEASHHIAA